MTNREPDHRLHISGPTADDAMEGPCTPSIQGLHTGQPKRDLGRKLINITKGHRERHSPHVNLGERREQGQCRGTSR